MEPEAEEGRRARRERSASRLEPPRPTARGGTQAKGAESGRAGPGSLGWGSGGPSHSPACLARRRNSCGRSGLSWAGGSRGRVGHGASSRGLASSGALERVGG